MKTLVTILPFALALAACGESAAPPAKQASAALQPGLYAVTSEVTSLTPADDGPPRVSFKQGDRAEEQVCVSAATQAGMPPAALAGLLAPGCQTTSLMLPSGNLAAQLRCTPPNLGGAMDVTVSGAHGAEDFTLTGQAATTLPTSGDVTATVRTTGRRVGACPA